MGFRVQLDQKKSVQENNSKNKVANLKGKSTEKSFKIKS